VICDLPPGGFPEYFTDVNAPGPASGGLSFFSSSFGAIGFDWAGWFPPILLVLLPNLSSGPSSCAKEKLLWPPGWWWTLTEVTPWPCLDYSIF